MIIVNFQYYDGEKKFHDTGLSGLPSKFNEMTNAVKFIESMRVHFRVVKVEIEYTEYTE